MTMSWLAERNATSDRERDQRDERCMRRVARASATSASASASSMTIAQPRRRPSARVSSGSGHAVDDRRPQEFQRVGEPDLGEEADRGERDVRLP